MLVPAAVVYLVSIPAESDDKVTQVDGAHSIVSHTSCPPPSLFKILERGRLRDGAEEASGASFPDRFGFRGFNNIIFKSPERTVY